MKRGSTKFLWFPWQCWGIWAMPSMWGGGSLTRLNPPYLTLSKVPFYSISTMQYFLIQKKNNMPSHLNIQFYLVDALTRCLSIWSHFSIAFCLEYLSGLRSKVMNFFTYKMIPCTKYLLRSGEWPQTTRVLGFEPGPEKITTKLKIKPVGQIFIEK